MIEIGEYVRTNYGRICKVINNDYFMPRYLECENEILIDRTNIVKHSKNIIDLIEEGDIIEYKVNSISVEKVGRVKKYIDARSNKEYLGVEGFDIKKIYVERILTYEQYEKKCYKLEE